MNAPLISNLLTSFYILLREHIHDRKLCMLDHAVAFLGKIQHSLISIVKGWSCDLIVFLGICSIQADGNRINILSKLRHDIASVVEISKTVRVYTDRKLILCLHIFSCFLKDIQRAGWFTVAAEDEFLIACKIKSINCGDYFVVCRINFVPERCRIAYGVLLRAYTECTSAVAFICDICINFVLVCIDYISHYLVSSNVKNLLVQQGSPLCCVKPDLRAQLTIR